MQLRKIRLEQGFAVPELCRRSEVPRRTIQDIEKRNECTVSTAKKLAKALGVTLDELCSNENETKE